MKRITFALIIILALPLVLLADEYDDQIKKALETAATNVAESKKQIDDVIKKFPDRGAAYIAKGLVLYHFESDVAHAADEFRKGMSKAQGAEERAAFIKLVDDQTSRAKSQEEYNLMQEAVDSRNKNEPEKTIEAMTKAIALNKLNWKIYYEMGYALIDANRHGEAIVYFEQGLAIDPFSNLLLSESIYTYSHLANVDKVKKMIALWTEYLGDAPELRHELAYAYLKSDKKDSAIQVLRENIEKFPAFLGSYYFIGEIYYDAGDCANAKQPLQHFIDENAKGPKDGDNAWLDEAMRMLEDCNAKEKEQEQDKG
ncbi:MAG TPA: hypothetical protein VF857_08880 [Spirochaetota bacterium]